MGEEPHDAHSVEKEPNKQKVSFEAESASKNNSVQATTEGHKENKHVK